MSCLQAVFILLAIEIDHVVLESKSNRTFFHYDYNSEHAVFLTNSQRIALARWRLLWCDYYMCAID